MQQPSKIATVGANTDGRDSATCVSAVMLSVADVATMLGCSQRTVYRLADSRRMPRPIKLGALVRWPREVIEGWIADGCPNCRTGGKGASR